MERELLEQGGGEYLRMAPGRGHPQKHQRFDPHLQPRAIAPGPRSDPGNWGMGRGTDSNHEGWTRPDRELPLDAGAGWARRASIPAPHQHRYHGKEKVGVPIPSGSAN